MTKDNLRILTISAHPHDWTWFAGTLGIHVERGDDVTVCIATHGGSTHNEKLAAELAKPEAERDQSIINAPPDAYIEQKERELRGAAALFGVTDLRMLNYADKPFTIARFPDCVRRIADLIIEVKPNVLITENPYHSGDSGLKIKHRNDHTEVGIATLEAKDMASTPTTGETGSAHKIAVTFFHGATFDPSEIDVFIDLSDEWFEKRVRAEAFYESQGHNDVWARRRMEVDIGHTGRIARTKYAEGFVREKPELRTHLPVPGLMREQASESSLERMARMVGKAGGAGS